MSQSPPPSDRPNHRDDGDAGFASGAADAPVPAPPEPWRPSTMPPVRPGPPFLMTEMIDAEPNLAVRLIRRLDDASSSAARLASAVADALARDEPVVVTGCGTSEHAALAIAEQIRDAIGNAPRVGTVRAAQAFELALDPPTRGLVIGVSHEGGTAATNRALEAARHAGASVGLITAAGSSPGAAEAAPELVVATEELDQSWCHTVGYVSPIVVGAIVAARLADATLDAGAVRELLAAPLRDTLAVERIASRLAGVDRLVVVASGVDRATGRELVLKVEEGAALPAAYRDLETFLHGHLAGVDERTGLVLVLADRRQRGPRIERSRQLLAAVGALGLPTAAILAVDVSASIPADSTTAGRIVVREAPELTASTAALLGTAVPLQLLAERLARARGRNPDAIRRDDPRYLAAAAAAE
ncbi:MAG TPA: SIS domain-containing protein [Candidatus Limnocylindrales bacterium]|nr:SIS domain-containing protein [Candidatus Limnocylindrales bacterium]